MVPQPDFGRRLRRAREKARKRLDELAEYLFANRYGRYYHASGRDQLIRFIWNIEDGDPWPDDHDFLQFVRLCVQCLARAGGKAVRDLALFGAVCHQEDGGQTFFDLFQNTERSQAAPSDAVSSDEGHPHGSIHGSTRQ